MVDISNSLKTSIERMRTQLVPVENNGNLLNFGRSYFEVDITQETLEFPIFGSFSILNTIRKSLDTTDPQKKIDKVILFLKEGSEWWTRPVGVDAIIKGGLTTTGISKVITKSNQIYYIGPGIILDKDFNILLNFKISGKIRYSSISNVNLEENVESILEVNNKVFLDQDDTINKVIIKKIIPYCLSNNPTAYRRYYHRGSFDMNFAPKPSILRVIYPSNICNNTLPSTETALYTNDINQFLKKNAYSFINSLCL